MQMLFCDCRDQNNLKVGWKGRRVKMEITAINTRGNKPCKLCNTYYIYKSLVWCYDGPQFCNISLSKLTLLSQRYIIRRMALFCFHFSSRTNEILLSHNSDTPRHQIVCPVVFVQKTVFIGQRVVLTDQRKPFLQFELQKDRTYKWLNKARTH